MQSTFVLELYYECDSQRELAEQVRCAHLQLVRRLAPHLQLQIHVGKATHISRSTPVVDGRQHNVPNQTPTSPCHQSLLITAENFGEAGLAGPGQGCLNESALRAKLLSQSDPADITVHEWLHTLEGQAIRECHLPSPDTSGLHTRFQRASGKAADGTDTWHDWYKYLLRE